MTLHTRAVETLVTRFTCFEVSGAVVGEEVIRVAWQPLFTRNALHNDLHAFWVLLAPRL